MSEKLSEHYELEIAKERWIILYKEIERLKTRLRFSLPLKLKTLLFDTGFKFIGSALLVWLSFHVISFISSYTESKIVWREYGSNFRIAEYKYPSTIQLIFVWAGILFVALLILSVCAATFLSIIKSVSLLFSKRVALNQLEQKVNELAKLEIEMNLRSNPSINNEINKQSDS